MGSHRRSTASLYFLFVLSTAHAGILRSGKPQLLCHRTANRDLPENTLQSLEFAAHMGCDIIEVDVRRTLDGELVLNHDGLLDRFTDTTGDVETTDIRELDGMDFGAWMGDRFRDYHIAHFAEALRLARNLNVGLYLDIKTKGIGPQVLAALSREGMTNRVVFGGEWDDIHHLDPHANEDASAGVQPDFKPEELAALHAQKKIVIASFILNGHEFDFEGMKRAVALGVDGIMVDYPRLGAEAVGRPVETRIELLSRLANTGTTDDRIGAIRELSYFTGLPLQHQFLHWLLDADQRVSHEAAIALVASRPQPPLALFDSATHSPAASARASAAWAIGTLAATAPDSTQCAPLLVPLLKDGSTSVLKQALIGLARCPSDPHAVPDDVLLKTLSSDVPILRGLAAVALARHHPHVAERALPNLLEDEEKTSDRVNAEWTAHGRPQLTQAQIDKAVELYRAQMKELEAIAALPGSEPLQALASQAFRPGHDYSMMPILQAGFHLWDRLPEDPAPALAALRSTDTGEADWAEWALVKAGPGVLPSVRAELPASQGDLRKRLIQILAWQADADSLPTLRSLEKSDPSDQELLRWAIKSIEAFQPVESKSTSLAAP